MEMQLTQTHAIRSLTPSIHPSSFLPHQNQIPLLSSFAVVSRIFASRSAFSVGRGMEGLEKFTSAEVYSHSSKNDCWLTIHGKVYDVSEFLEDHPGGDAILIQASGNGDTTEAFEEIGHSEQAEGMMDCFLVGVLDGYDHTKVVVRKKKPRKAVKKPRSNSGRRSDDGEMTFTWVDYVAPIVILIVALVSWYFLTFGDKNA